MRTILAIVFLGVACQAASPVRVMRTVDTREPGNLALALVHGETVDLRVRISNYKDPVDLTGYAITLHGRTNGQSAAESYSVTGYVGTAESAGAATNGWASVDVNVSAWWPATAAAGTWTLLATNATDRIARAGGPLTVGGTAAADAQAPLPTSVAAEIMAALAASGTVWRAEWQGDVADGDAEGLTNHVAAVAAEALLRIQGDAASLASARSQLRDFAATGGVYRLAGADWWLTSTNGSVVLWLIEDDTNRVKIASASVDFNGPAVGTVFNLSPDGLYTNVGDTYYVFLDYTAWMLRKAREEVDWRGPSSLAIPATLSPFTGDDTAGTCVIEWGIATNAYPLARAVDALRRDGTLPMTGDLDMDGHSITNLSPNTIYFTDGRNLPGIIPSAGWRNDVYWSIGMEERYQAIAETVTTTNQDVITYREIAGIGKINWQITPDVLRGFPDGAFGYSVSGTAGSINQDGLLTMTEAGLVDVTVTNGATSKTVAVDLYYSSAGEDRSVVYAGVTGSARAAAIAGIDGRLSGGGSAEYWLTNSPPSTFTTNPACWAAAADFSGVVVGTGTGAAAWYGTMITTQHILQCKHAYNGVGSVKRFRGRSGTNYVRTVTAIYKAGGDFAIGKLNAPLPPNDVAVYKVMPADYVSYFPTGFNSIPAMIYNQNGRAAVCVMSRFDFIAPPTTSPRLDYWELPYGGDSGRPCFLWVGNELVLMFLFSSATLGNNSPITYRDAMNALLAPDGAALTTIDLSAFTEF